jgi:hypothetical protein
VTAARAWRHSEWEVTRAPFLHEVGQDVDLMRAGRTAMAVAIVVVLTGTFVALVLWFLPPLLVDQASAGLEGGDLAKAVTDERRTVLAALAAIGAAVTLWYTHQRQSARSGRQSHGPVHQGCRPTW